MNIWCAVDTESNQYQQGSDIVTRSTEWLTESETKSSVLWESFSFHIHEQIFFYILEWTGETGSLHAYKCKYICTEVHANLIAQSRTIYLVAMSFGENMWGETSSIFLLITTTLVWKENISWSVSVINLLYKNLLLGCHYTYLFQHSFSTFVNQSKRL